MKVILIEDDKQIRELLPRYFFREGMEAVSAATGYEGLDAIYEGKPDIALLDVNLPDIDGWSVLRRIRQSESADMPVIMLTGRGELSDKLLGLEMGADDYIVKPFEPMEVVARVKAVLRRAKLSGRQKGTISAEGITIDSEARTVLRMGKAVQLTAKEFDVLLALASSKGIVIGRSELYERAWGEELLDDDHTLEVHINKIRTKLEGEDGLRYITTVRGVGYRFEVMRDGR